MTLPDAVRSLAHFLLRQKLVITAVVIVAGGGALAYILSQPPRYVASASLLAKIGREYVFRQDSSGNAALPIMYTQEEIINSLVEILQSEDIANTVVNVMGAETLYPDLVENPPRSGSVHAAAVDNFMKALKVTPARRANVILVDFGSEKPQLAADALANLVDAFQTKIVALYGEKRLAFLEEELDRVKQELERSQSELAIFEKSNQAYAIDSQVELLVKQRAELDSQRRRLLNCCAAGTAVERLTGQIGQIDAEITSLNSRKHTLQQLTLKRDHDRDMYDAHLRRVEDARVSANMDRNRITSVEVIDRPVAPSSPAKPGKLVKSALAILFSLVLALLLAGLLDLISKTFVRATDVQKKFNVPILAEVPRVRL